MQIDTECVSWRAVRGIMPRIHFSACQPLPVNSPHAFGVQSPEYVSVRAIKGASR